MRIGTKQCKILSIAGPKGGVGRSSFTIELGLSLVQNDQSVLMIDLDPIRQGLAILLDMPAQTMQDALEFLPLRTSTPQLDMVLLSLRTEQVLACLEKLRADGKYDYVIIDLPPCMGEREAEIVLLSDLPVLMANAEPASLFAATQCLRFCTKQLLSKNAATRDILPFIDPIRDSWNFSQIYKTLPQNLQAAFASALVDFRISFVLNQRRESSEIQQCQALCHGWAMLLGVLPTFLGTIAHEERRWFFARKISPNSQFQREDLIVSDYNQISSKVLDFEHIAKKQVRALPIIDVSQNPRDFLLISGNEDFRASYRRLWEGYRRENGLVASVLDAENIARIIQLLETALRATNSAQNTANATNALTKTQEQTEDDTQAGRRLSSQLTGALPWKAEAVVKDAGENLKHERESRELMLQQLSLFTRIPKRVLEQLEAQEIANLEPQYLQAYLIELAIFYEIEASQILTSFGFSCNEKNTQGE